MYLAHEIISLRRVELPQDVTFPDLLITIRVRKLSLFVLNRIVSEINSRCIQPSDSYTLRTSSASHRSNSLAVGAIFDCLSSSFLSYRLRFCVLTTC